MAKDIESDRWMNIKIALSANAANLIKVKKAMKEYAEELDWVLETDKEGWLEDNRIRRYDITISPKTGKISPEEFAKIKSKLVGFVFSILKDVIGEKLEVVKGKQIIKTHISASKDWKRCYIKMGDILTIYCDIKDFLQLEKLNPKLVENLFSVSLRFWKEELIKDLKLKKFWFNRNKKEKENVLQAIHDLEKIGV